jgi:hypothetical protein
MVLRRMPSPSATASAPVSTASTPGMASAAAVSMPRITPCARGLRTTAMWVQLGRMWSSV